MHASMDLMSGEGMSFKDFLIIGYMPCEWSRRVCPLLIEYNYKDIYRGHTLSTHKACTLL